jgi:hypothetical protein
MSMRAAYCPSAFACLATGPATLSEFGLDLEPGGHTDVIMVDIVALDWDPTDPNLLPDSQFMADTLTALGYPTGPAETGHEDFTLLTPGASASTPDGWTVTRSGTNASVRTGLITMDTHIAANTARIARPGSTNDLQGLLLEDPFTNAIMSSDSVLTLPPWTIGTNPAAASAVLSPNGTTTADAVHAAQATYSNYQNVAPASLGTPASTLSFWYRPSAGQTTTRFEFGENGGLVEIPTGLTSLAWNQIVVTDTGIDPHNNTGRYVGIPDNTTTPPATSATTFAGHACFYQYELGPKAHSYLSNPSTTLVATFPQEYVHNAPASQWVANGQFNAEFTIIPGAASGSYGRLLRIMTDPGNPDTFIELDDATGEFLISQDGNQNFTTNAPPTWNGSTDKWSVYIRYGANQPTVVGYRLNGGAATYPAYIGVPLQDVVFVGTPDFFCDSSDPTKRFYGTIQKVTRYHYMRHPTWITPPAPNVPVDEGQERVFWTFGDSRVATTSGSPSGPHAVFPWFVWKRLGGTQWGELQNVAVSGTRVQDTNAAFAAATASLDPTKHNIAIILSGWNNMMNLQFDTPPLDSPTQVVAALMAFVALCHGKGMDVWIMTQTSSDGPAPSATPPPHSYNGEDWDGTGNLRDQVDGPVNANAVANNYRVLSILNVPGVGPNDSCLNGQNITYVDEVHPTGGEYVSGTIQAGEGRIARQVCADYHTAYGY